MLSIKILTISDTRDLESDKSGQLIASLLGNAYQLSRELVKDEILEISHAIEKEDFDILICNGGTGIAKRDLTFEAVQPFIAQEIPGFGEIFRWLSYQDIGSHAIASRALAFFTKSDKLIFALPGSTKACQLAMEKLILPELDHLIKERRK